MELFDKNPLRLLFSRAPSESEVLLGAFNVITYVSIGNWWLAVMIFACSTPAHASDLNSGDIAKLLEIARWDTKELMASLKKNGNSATLRQDIRMTLTWRLKMGDTEESVHSMLGQPLDVVDNTEYYPDGVGVQYLPIEGVRRYVDANLYVSNGDKRIGPAFMRPLPYPALVRIGLPRNEVEKHFRLPEYLIGDIVIYDTAILRYKDNAVAEVREPLHGSVFINSDRRTVRKRFADALDKIKVGHSRADAQKSLILISEISKTLEYYWPDKHSYTRSFDFALRLEFKDDAITSVALCRLDTPAKRGDVVRLEDLPDER